MNFVGVPSSKAADNLEDSKRKVRGGGRQDHDVGFGVRCDETCRRMTIAGETCSLACILRRRVCTRRGRGRTLEGGKDEKEGGGGGCLGEKKKSSHLLERKLEREPRGKEMCPDSFVVLPIRSTKYPDVC